MTDYRILRVPLPATLIRQVDEIVEMRLGGYSDRGEFVRDAVEAMVLETRYVAESDQASSDSRSALAAVTTVKESRMAEGAGISVDLDAVDLTPFAQTALAIGERGVVVETGEAHVRDEPLFGLHNRDFPTLWALAEVARLTRKQPIVFDDFRTRVADQAWSFGERLLELERATGQKLTALFPTNRAKPESSEGAFLDFAVGNCSVSNGQIRAHGPLFTWQLCQLVRQGANVTIGLLPQGYELLEAVAGLTIETPHPEDMAVRFLEHLRSYATADFKGFYEVLQEISGGVSRRELVEAIHGRHPDWTETVAATNSAGYVARSREWGLVAPKLAAGRYVLTEFGQRQLSEGGASNGGN